jgi:predicted transcriptional regulator
MKTRIDLLDLTTATTIDDHLDVLTTTTTNRPQCLDTATMTVGIVAFQNLTKTNQRCTLLVDVTT